MLPRWLEWRSVAALVLDRPFDRGKDRKPPSWVLHGTYSPTIDPANFVATIDNRYFPSSRARRFHYEGFKGKTPQTDDVVVTHQDQRILGVRVTVVRDTVSRAGKPIERTYDWYAQDKQGNVWYMGEDSRELSTAVRQGSDSWEAGVERSPARDHHARRPEAGDAYRQEYYPPGEALDQARVLGLSGSLTVPYGAFTECSSRASGARWNRRPRRSTTRRAWARSPNGWSRAPRTVQAGQRHAGLSPAAGLLSERPC